MSMLGSAATCLTQPRSSLGSRIRAEPHRNGDGVRVVTPLFQGQRTVALQPIERAATTARSLSPLFSQREEVELEHANCILPQRLSVMTVFRELPAQGWVNCNSDTTSNRSAYSPLRLDTLWSQNSRVRDGVAESGPETYAWLSSAGTLIASRIVPSSSAGRQSVAQRVYDRGSSWRMGNTTVCLECSIVPGYVAPLGETELFTDMQRLHRCAQSGVRLNDHIFIRRRRCRLSTTPSETPSEGVTPNTSINAATATTTSNSSNMMTSLRSPGSNVPYGFSISIGGATRSFGTTRGDVLTTTTMYNLPTVHHGEDARNLVTTPVFNAPLSQQTNNAALLFRRGLSLQELRTATTVISFEGLSVDDVVCKASILEMLCTSSSNYILGEKRKCLSSNVGGCDSKDVYYYDDVYSRQIASFALTRSSKGKPQAVFRFDEDLRDDATRSCAICCGEFYPGEPIRLIHRCCHRYHVACVDRWFEQNNTCPICRRNLRLSVDEKVTESVERYRNELTRAACITRHHPSVREWVSSAARSTAQLPAVSQQCSEGLPSVPCRSVVAAETQGTASGGEESDDEQDRQSATIRGCHVDILSRRYDELNGVVQQVEAALPLGLEGAVGLPLRDIVPTHQLFVDNDLAEQETQENQVIPLPDRDCSRVTRNNTFNNEIEGLCSPHTLQQIESVETSSSGAQGILQQDRSPSFDSSDVQWSDNAGRKTQERISWWVSGGRTMRLRWRSSKSMLHRPFRRCVSVNNEAATPRSTIETTRWIQTDSGSGKRSREEGETSRNFSKSDQQSDLAQRDAKEWLPTETEMLNYNGHMASRPRQSHCMERGLLDRFFFSRRSLRSLLRYKKDQGANCSCGGPQSELTSDARVPAQLPTMLFEGNRF